MGQMAEDILDGACCALCGQYFEIEHGYPIACTDCWDEKCGYQKATENLI